MCTISKIFTKALLTKATCKYNILLLFLRLSLEMPFLTSLYIKDERFCVTKGLDVLMDNVR